MNERECQSEASSQAKAGDTLGSEVNKKTFIQELCFGAIRIRNI